MNLKSLICFLVVALISADVMAARSQPLHLKTYKGQGVDQVDQSNGQQLWNSVVNKRSCTNCHGDAPANIGKHIKTGKIIQPMALSVNSQRYQDGRKVEKWFLRNCKWTFGRACNVQEKADILSWLSNL